MKTAKEWIASVKDPVIKRYLEEAIVKSLASKPKKHYGTFLAFVDSIDWEATPQGFDFYYAIHLSDPSTLSYSDFKHLDKSVTQLNEDKETQKMQSLTFKVEFNDNKGLHILTNQKGDTYGSMSEEFYDFIEESLTSVEQPKVSVNEDAVEFAEWIQDSEFYYYENQGWYNEGFPNLMSKYYNKWFTTTELYQNYLEDKHK